MSRKKRSDLKITKDKAVGWFSKYIRLKYADSSGMNLCVTCGIRKHWKDMHAGHFVDGRNNTVLFNEMLVHPQCFHCNSKHWGCLAGNKVRYSIFMMNKYGLTKEDILKLDDLKMAVNPVRVEYFQTIIDKYEPKVLELLKGISE